MGEMITTNGNGTRAFWTAAGPIVVTIALAAVGFIVASVSQELSTQDTRIDRLEENRSALVERLSRIEVSSQATAYDVQQIRRLLERRDAQEHQ